MQLNSKDGEVIYMSEKITREIVLDFYENKNVIVNAKQYDKESRYLLISCMNQGAFFRLSNEQHMAFIRYRKADELSVFNKAEITEEGKVIVELTEQMLAAEGMCIADLVITESEAEITDEGINVSNGSVISTMSFVVKVLSTAIDNSEIESNYEFSALNELLNKATADYDRVIKETSKNAERAETAATSAQDSATLASDAKDKAESSASAASASEKNALASELAAKTSQDASARSESNAEASAVKAKASENAAKASQDAALQSEQNAAESEQNSENNMNAAAGSAKKSEASATASQNSAEAAEASAESASASKTAAEKSAQSASDSERKSLENMNASFESASNASESAKAAKLSETAADASASKAAASETKATQKANDAAESASSANTSKQAAATSANDSKDWSLWSKSYAIGEGEKRLDEETDNAKYYYEQARRISQGLEGSLLPMGTITFSQLATSTKQPGYMYNISDAFTSDSTFADGGNHQYGAGSNVYYTADQKWDVLAAVVVTGVKGSSESTYRQGNVNITKANVGLGNVPNVTTDNQTPSFTQATTRENIATGEKLTTLFGKIAKWFSDLKDGAFHSVANNLATTESGSVLDARQGKVLNDNKVAKSGDTMTGDLTMSGTSRVIKYASGARTGTPISMYAGDGNGSGLVIGDGGRTIIGGGEAANNLRTALGTTAANESAEELHLANDQDIKVHTNCQNIAERKTFTFGSNGKFTAESFAGKTNETTVDYTTADVADGTSSLAWTKVDPLTSGMTHANFFNRVSIMFKNLRYLYKMLGTTDISKIGGGTVTGAISSLNSDKVSTTDARLSDARTPKAHTHTWANITNPPATYAPSAHTHAEITSTGTFAARVKFHNNGSNRWYSSPIPCVNASALTIEIKGNVILDGTNDQISVGLFSVVKSKHFFQVTTTDTSVAGYIFDTLKPNSMFTVNYIVR